MVHRSIPLYNSFGPLDTSRGTIRKRSRKKKITTETEEKFLPTHRPESSNAGRGVQKLSLDQRKSQLIPQTIHQNLSVHRSVQPFTQIKTTHTGPLAADDQDESYFSDALSELGSESQDEYFDALQTLPEDTSPDAQSTPTLPEHLPESHRTASNKTLEVPTGFIIVKRKGKRLPHLPKKATAVLPAKNTHDPEKPKWQNGLLTITENYFNSYIKPYISKKFLKGINCHNLFLRFNELVQRPLAELNEQDVSVLSNLVIPLGYSHIPINYRLCVFEFAIQTYTIAGSACALQGFGFNCLKLIEIAMAVEHSNREKNNGICSPSQDNYLSVQDAQGLLQSIINLFVEVQKKQEPGCFFTLLIPSRSNYSQRGLLFSLMAKLLYRRGLEALRALMETEDIVEICTWKEILKTNIGKYDEKQSKKSSWESINIALALMESILYMNKQKSKAGAVALGVNLYIEVEDELKKTLDILKKTGGSNSLLYRFERMLSSCELYSITVTEFKGRIPVKEHLERLKEALDKNSERNRHNKYNEKKEKRMILKSLVHIIVEDSQRQLQREKEIFCLDIHSTKIQEEVNSYITDYHKLNRELADLDAGEQDALSTSPLLSNRPTDSASEKTKTKTKTKSQNSSQNEVFKEDAIVIECSFKRICLTISKRFEQEKVQEQYENTIKNKLKGIKIYLDRKKMEDINWLLLVDLSEAKSKLEEAEFSYPHFRSIKANLLENEFNDWEGAIKIYEELISQGKKKPEAVTRQGINSTPTHLQSSGSVELTPAKSDLSESIMPVMGIDNDHVYSQLAMCYKNLAESTKEEEERKEYFEKAFLYAIKIIDGEENLIKYAGVLQKIADAMKNYQFEYSDYRSQLPLSLTNLADSKKQKISSWEALTQFLHFKRPDKNYYPEEAVLIRKK